MPCLTLGSAAGAVGWEAFCTRTYRVCRRGFSVGIPPYFPHSRLMFQSPPSVPEDGDPSCTLFA